jgi:succinyl-CoA synthetase beta subunit
MNIHEYQAKQLFRAYHIPVPEGRLASTAEEAESMAKTLNDNGSCVVKAQIHAGGRGKAGGVKLAQNAAEAGAISRELLGKNLVTLQTGSLGLPINSVLLELTYPIKREMYLSLILDRAAEKLVFIASKAGGLDIEEVARDTPEQIISIAVHLAAGLQDYQCRTLAYALA